MYILQLHACFLQLHACFQISQFYTSFYEYFIYEFNYLNENKFRESIIRDKIFL